MVSTAGLDDPFRPLLKKMSPTVTAAVLGVAPPVPPPVPPAGGVGVGVGLVDVGLVGVFELSLQPATMLAVNKPPTSSVM